MLIDLHSHTNGISSCCAENYKVIIDVAKSVGLDGIVLTNHYQRWYIQNPSYKHGFFTSEEFAKLYVEEYQKTKRYGDEQGVKVFFGVELTPDYDTRVHLLIYGITPQFLLKYNDLYKYSLRELYSLVKENGFALVQAHPFRNGTTVQDTNCLDGLEINCHPKYQTSYADTLVKIAQDNKLALICGADFHHDTYRPVCGTFIPDTVTSDEDLKNFILTTDSITLRVHEVDAPTYYDKTYKLNR